MKILTAAQTREADRLTSERAGIPSLQLMENAGTAVADFIEAQFPDMATRRIAILCGRGNNGGDGLVVARLLKTRGAAPIVVLFAAGDSVKGDAAVNLDRWQRTFGGLRTVTQVSDWQAIKDSVAEADLVVDALLGTGLKGPVEGLLGTVIEDLNTFRGAQSRKMVVVSVDTPSGLPSDTVETTGPVVRADYTITFTAPKVGQLVGRECSRVGKLLVRHIGTPPKLLEDDPQLKLHWLEPGEFRSLPLRRHPEAHKGDFGHALILAGSRGKSGAAVLAAWAALRVGAGLVTVATPDDVLPIVASGLPEMMTAPLAATEAGTVSIRNLDYGRFAQLTEAKSVLAIGPGISTHQETQQFVRTIVADCPLPIILDADGLNAFAKQADKLSRRKAQLAVTPHPGEMARLLGCTTKDVQSRRLEVTLESAERWNAFVILKGYHTILAAPDGRAWINSTGNPGMASGGTGDVLTGMLAGLTAQFGVAEWHKALGFGVYLHGLAGDLAAAQVGQAPLIASDLIAAIPEAFRELLSELDLES